MGKLESIPNLSMNVQLVEERGPLLRGDVSLYLAFSWLVISCNITPSSLFDCYYLRLNNNGKYITMIMGGSKSLKSSWYSKLSFVVKVFIWRALIRGLRLGLALKWHGLAMGNCFFCIVQVEDSAHCFIQVRSIVMFGVTFLKFGKFCHVVVWHLDNGCLHNSHMSTQNQR